MTGYGKLRTAPPSRRTFPHQLEIPATRHATAGIPTATHSHDGGRCQAGEKRRSGLNRRHDESPMDAPRPTAREQSRASLLGLPGNQLAYANRTVHDFEPKQISRLDPERDADVLRQADPVALLDLREARR